MVDTAVAPLLPTNSPLPYRLHCIALVTPSTLNEHTRHHSHLAAYEVVAEVEVGQGLVGFHVFHEV